MADSDRLLLKTGAAEYWPSLVGAKRYGGFRAAFGADCACFGAGSCGTCSPFGLAFLAVLRIVDKLFCVKKPLLVCGKDKVLAANDTL